MGLERCVLIGDMWIPEIHEGVHEIHVVATIAQFRGPVHKQQVSTAVSRN